MQSQHCDVAVALSQVGSVLAVASSGIIFGYRVTAIWNGNTIIKIVVGIFYVIMVGCWVGIQYLWLRHPVH